MTKIDTEELFQAYYDCRSNKRNTANALAFEMNYESKLLNLCEEINNGTYSPGRSIAFVVEKPVKREIFAADFRDRVVHHLIINKLNPLFEKQFIYDSYACRTGKGTHFGINRVTHFIRQCSQNYQLPCHILKLDIEGFFMHIDKNILFNRLQSFINEKYIAPDKELLIELCKKVIDNDPTKNCFIKGNQTDWNNLPATKSLFHIGHIDRLVKRAVDSGNDVMKALQCACVNPVKHYGLEVGLLQPGDPADFIEIDNLKDFSVLKTFINGELVAEKGRSFLPQKTASVINNFNTNKKKVTDFLFPVADGHVAHPDIIGASPLQINVIEALDGQLITNKLTANVKIENGNAVSDIENDVLKLAVINRYSDARPAIAFIKNFGFKKGAIASSVAHDSHNVIAVGVDDENICKAVNLVIEQKGGLSVAANDIAAVLPLPIAGLMTNENGYKVSARYTKLDKLAKELGSTLKSPFMTLSFMALLVIPEIKLSDKGLFDGGRFEFMEVFKKLAIDPE